MTSEKNLLHKQAFDHLEAILNFSNLIVNVTDTV